MGFEIPLRSKTAEGVLNTSFEVRKAVGEPPAVIRVRNLKTSISGPQDAWGRKGTLQPMTVSAEISMATAFEASSSTDAVSYDTVHYGLLSKRILSFIQSMNAEKAVLPEGTGYWALPVLVGGLFEELAGRNTNGTKTPMYDSCLLRNQKFQHLGVKVLLPKASLLGSGVSLAAAIWIPNNVQDPICRRSMTATIHELRVPTLVGVNPHERLAKQIVVATVEVERLHTMDINFNELEAVIVKTMDDSSFETLEALTVILAGHITKHLKSVYEAPEDGQGWQLKILLEKPTAVTSADGACVELTMKTNTIAVSQ